MGKCFSKEATTENSQEEKEENLNLEEIKEIFKYENMVKSLITDHSSYLVDEHKEFGASKSENVFFRFGYMHEVIEKEVGWKVHISINDSDKKNLAKAWDVVEEILIEEKLQAKIVMPDADFYKDSQQCGKQITIYCHMTFNRNWESIFNRIEDSLYKAEIQSGEFSPGDRQIPESNYLSYRNDDNGHGKYISSNSDYNPSRQSDPFINFSLEPKNQHQSFRL